MQRKQAISMELENRISTLYNLFLDGFFENFFQNLQLANSLIGSNIEQGSYNLYIINEHHVITHSTKQKEIGMDLSVNKSVYDVLQMLKLNPHKVFLSPPLIDIKTKQIHYYAITLLPDSKNFLEISFSTIFPDDINIRLKEISHNFNIASSSIYLYHQDESFAYNYQTQAQLSSDKFTLLLKKIEKCNQDGEASISTCINNNNLLISFDAFNKNQGYRFVLDIKTEIIDDFQYHDIEKIILYSSMLILIAISLFVFLIQRSIVAPLRKLTYAVVHNHHIQDDDLLKHKDFSILVKSLNTLRKKLKKQTQRRQHLLDDQKAFVGNSIHELSTPLNVISINAQMLEMLSPENENITLILGAVRQIGMIKEDIAYLLINDKINYAPIDIKLCSFVKKRIEYFHPILDANEKQIDFTCKTESSLYISEVELSLLLDNNISNAIKYGKNDSKIKIEVTENINTTDIYFISYGDDIIDADKIFKRFYRENRDRKGFGIGLNIVKHICDIYNAHYAVGSQKGRNTFAYHFPKQIEKE